MIYNKTMRQYIPKNAKLIPENAECKFRGELFDVYQWPQEMFDGSVSTFEMLKRQDTVITIAIHDNKIIITRQRQPRQDWFFDYPGGRHDHSSETELEAAKRELREETGLSFQNWKLVNVTQPFSKIDWLIYTFLATDFIKQEPQKLDAGEEIEIMEVTFDELREYAKKPNAKYLLPEFLQNITTLDELKNLPALHEY